MLSLVGDCHLLLLSPLITRSIFKQPIFNNFAEKTKKKIPLDLKIFCSLDNTSSHAPAKGLVWCNHIEVIYFPPIHKTLLQSSTHGICIEWIRCSFDSWCRLNDIRHSTRHTINASIRLWIHLYSVWCCCCCRRRCLSSCFIYFRLETSYDFRNDEIAESHRATDNIDFYFWARFWWHNFQRAWFTARLSADMLNIHNFIKQYSRNG